VDYHGFFFPASRSKKMMPRSIGWTWRWRAGNELFLYWRAIGIGSNGTLVWWTGREMKPLYEPAWVSFTFWKAKPREYCPGPGQLRFVASTALPEVDISLLSHRDIGFIMKGVFLNFGSNVSLLSHTSFLLFYFFLCFRRALQVFLAYLTQISQIKGVFFIPGLWFLPYTTL